VGRIDLVISLSIGKSEAEKKQLIIQESAEREKGKSI
jgi:hypothetical protein